MATIDQLSAALVKADAAGDTEGARILAGEIRKMRSEAAPQPLAEKPSFGQLFKQQVVGSMPVQSALGALRGAGSIGATLLSPIDAITGRTDRRESMDAGLREMGADPESLAYQGGKLGAEIAGTLPVGGVLAKGVSMIPGAATKAAPLIQALRTGGMSAGGATGPAALAARVAGGAATGGTAAAMVNPEDAGTGAVIGGALPVAGQLAKGGIAAARNIIGATTGVGDEALRTAFSSGKAGGTQAQALRENMRGTTSMLDVLDDAKANLADIKAARSAAYQSNMAAVKEVKKPLDMSPIDKAISDSFEKFTFKGQAKDPKALAAINEASRIVNDWKNLPANEFHTPEGIDALKQQISALRENLPIEARSSRAALDNVVNAVKRQIQAEAPEYSKAMSEYHKASDLIDEISRSLSLNDRASADTAMRKLQSVMRNNVNTNYGARAGVMRLLEEQGGRNITSALAGQSLNDWMPRGIQRATGAGLSLGAGTLGGIPAAAGAAAISSPRLMGEAAYLAGTGARVADPLIQALRAGGYRAAPVLGAQ